MSNKGKIFDVGLLKRVFGFVKPFRGIFIFTSILIFIIASVSIVRPLLIGDSIDNYIESGDKQGLLYIVLLIVGVLLLESILQFFFTYYTNLLGQNVTLTMREKIYKHILDFKLKYFDKNPIGALVTRVISDIDGIANIFSEGVLVILGEVLKLIIVFGAMFYINWKLTLFVLFPIPLLIIGTRIFGRAIKKAFNTVRNQVSAINVFVQEHVTGMFVVQIFNREKAEFSKFEELNEKHKKANFKAIWAYSIFFPFVEMLSALSLSSLIYFGIIDITSYTADKVTPGELFSFIFFINMLYRPIRQLADRFNTLQMGIVNAERVFKVLDTKEEIESNYKIKNWEVQGNIRFEDVWFAYKENDWVLKGISFDVKKGESIAFVGATGAGKTSITNLIGRFYEFQKGRIFLDDKNIQDYHIKLIRNHIAVVLQDVFLFSDTILNNITLNNQSISREQVVEASKLVGAHDFIMKLPGNYDFDVKERGGMLSVGQRQLLAFIRAYVYQPKILILDEATSSIDTETESLIQNATDLLTKGRTSIIIAHRLSTIRKADKIIVMDKGIIVEEGTHKALVEKGGQYKKLYDLQLKSTDL